MHACLRKRGEDRISQAITKVRLHVGVSEHLDAGDQRDVELPQPANASAFALVDDCGTTQLDSQRNRRRLAVLQGRIDDFCAASEAAAVTPSS